MARLFLFSTLFLGIASSAPTPSIDKVIAVKSPSATPTAIGRAVRQPWPSA